MNTDSHRSAILVLQDGTIFKGRSIGAEGLSSGEVVFNTSMTGYQEILTDPSYARQIITFTHPHIGNTGTNTEDEESSRIWAAGLVIRDLPALASNFRSERSLDVYLKEKNILGISDIDTRKLTRILREKGAQSGCLMAGDIDEGVALQVACDFAGLEGVDLAKVVTTTTVFKWTEGSWKLGSGHQQSKNSLYKIVAYDFGVKRNILRMLVDRGADLTVVPAQTSAAEVLEMNPDGIFLSNGPGDPQPCTYAVDSIREILKTDIPIFGICLGHQLLALASGAKTMKMKFGHHGANHPVKDIGAGKVVITSQNHGFSVDERSLPSTLRVTHYSLFDGSVQGIHRTDKPAFGFQGHPEASPGPHEASLLFDHFFELISYAKKN
ncbi:glutamine-hydrolyzing carbamoyl-phosphate synthase small subunit [Porticoccus sp. Uisw_050_02]|uniref:glutamine-hydrolyzing carbamoyl-phosphate synthase small subunit n=1 Tax=Porticoccus sp. Uisw_050_02 TaxID=3230978 RepID=UPI0039E914DF